METKRQRLDREIRERYARQFSLYAGDSSIFPICFFFESYSVVGVDEHEVRHGVS